MRPSSHFVSNTMAVALAGVLAAPALSAPPEVAMSQAAVGSTQPVKAPVREWETWKEAKTAMIFVAIPKGCFEMGTAKPLPPKFGDLWFHLEFKGSLSPDEMPRHKVCVDGFWLGQDEVRWREWHAVMGGDPPAGKEDLPVIGITWHQAKIFAERLSAESPDNSRFRLPTEAEWEYACRASDPVDEIAYTSEAVGRAWHNTAGLRLNEAKPVGELPPNKFGLQDMLGNVWEWVEDAYLADAYKQHDLYNPLQHSADREAPDTPRVIRGGSYRSEPTDMRCANRSRYASNASLPQIGLRLVRKENE
jgi:formylglycine-generating enzyme required for sulfatase activity